MLGVNEIRKISRDHGRDGRRLVRLFGPGCRGLAMSLALGVDIAADAAVFQNFEIPFSEQYPESAESPFGSCFAEVSIDPIMCFSCFWSLP